MSDHYRLYIVKEKDKPEISYLHPSKKFLEAGSELVSDLLQGQRVIVDHMVTEEELPEVLRELNLRQQAIALGQLYPTREFPAMVKKAAPKSFQDPPAKDP